MVTAVSETHEPSESAAFDDWYRVARPRAVAVVAGAFGDRRLAEDVTDEAMLRAWRNWPRVHAMRRPDAWVVRVAINEARRQLGRRNRLVEPHTETFEALCLPPDDNDGMRDLWALVERLPEREKLAVVLRHLGDLREADVATVMGVRRGTVSRTLREAYRKLERGLRDENAERRPNEQ